MIGSLTLVATPIGNLGDLSPRAVEALREADFIAAEDTRVTLKLLNHFGIHKEMVSYYEHNERQRGALLLERMLAGEHCVIVSDAGMPCISDPGEQLVARCAEAGVPVTVIPGPSAAIAALAVSGLPTARFAFEGFLSMNKKNRREHLRSLREDPHTLIFYEAPHKLPYTLADLYEAFGDRRITLVRELTKLHEEIIRTTLAAALARYQAEKPRGEFVLIVEGAAPVEEPALDLDEAVTRVLSLAAAGTGLSAAAKQVARETGHPKSELYRRALGTSDE